VGLAVGGLVAGVRACGGGSEDQPEPADPGSPRGVAEAFATTWTNGDIAGLYLLLNAQSQSTYPVAAFQEAYGTFARETTLESLEATVESIDGAAAMLAVRMSTGYFGELEHTTRINLTQTGTDWRVEWEPSAIHPEMANGRQLDGVLEWPTRGRILAADGSELAVTRELRMIGLNRSLVQDRAALVTALAPFGIGQAQVDAAFAAPGGPTQRVSLGQVPDAITDAQLSVLTPVPGVVLYFQSQRVHPLGAAAAHVVGYTREFTAEELAERQGRGYEIGDRTGAVGLEASQEEILAGRVGAELRVVDGAGATVSVIASQEFVQGQDVQTTLDPGALVATHARLGERVGSAVVIDPVTNAVLALNSSPSYDPDAFERNDAVALNALAAAPNNPQLNRATRGVYSAGSTFKLITGAAGLAFGGASTGDRYECGSIWNGVDPPRRNWEGAQGSLTIAEALMRSCNPVFYQIGLDLYNETDGKLSEMARLFGFGAPTGVEGLGEEEGLVPDAEWKRAVRGESWFPGDEVNLAIGQGDLLITPLQLANAYSTFLAGVLRNPVIIAGKEATPRGELPLTAEQSAQLKRGLELVTSASGTASAAFALAGYTGFGGKSGTAEDAGEQQHVLFVAYGPASAPRAVAAVVLDDGQSGSIEAGPMARDMVIAALE
jgi:penicillin-binding protein 2